jgi:hypothetical protein
MSTFLNILLLIVSTAATLSAFGGEAWKRGAKPLRHRITRRGWISLGCLATALILGVAKEIQSHVDDNKKQRALDSVSGDLKTAQTALGQANQRLYDLNLLLSQTESEVGVEKLSLDVLQRALTSAHADLSRQSNVNLLSLLANTKQTVRLIEIAIPFTTHAVTARRAYDILVPSGHSCRFGNVESWVLSDSPAYMQGITYRNGDNIRELESHDDHNGNNFSDYLSYPYGGKKMKRAIADLVGQQSYNFRTLYMEFWPKDRCMLVT